MTFRRIIPSLRLDRDGRLDEPVSFQTFEHRADPGDVATAYAAVGADELMLTCSQGLPATLLPRIESITASLPVPLSLEADAANSEEFADLLSAGVSRIILQRAALRAPDLLARLAREFGSEQLTVAITARREGDVLRVSEGIDGELAEWDPVTWARVAEAQGAGELVVRSPDGGQHGEPFDLELLKAVTSAVHLPVIATASPGQVEDVFDALMIGGADGVALAAPLHSGLLTVRDIKLYLAEHGIPVRLS